VKEILAEEDRFLIVHRERCTRLLVRTAGRNVKYHLNQMALDLFTVRNVTRNIDRKDFSRECVGKLSKIGMIFPLVGNNQGEIFLFF